MSSRYLAALVALGSVWGSSFLFIKVVVDETAPIELATGRASSALWRWRPSSGGAASG